MTEQEAVRYTLKGVELTAHKDEKGCLLIARADKETSHSNSAVEIRPNPSAGRTIGTGPAGKWWFKLFTPPGSGGPAFDTADMLEKAVEKAEAKLLEEARREASYREEAALASASVAKAGEILDSKIDQWLEHKRSEDGCEG